MAAALDARRLVNTGFAFAHASLREQVRGQTKRSNSRQLFFVSRSF